MLCIHKITYIHHAEGCKMHRGHYISLKVAAWLLHDSWRATVFLLHVPFYGHQLGAYNVLCAGKKKIISTITAFFPIRRSSTHPLYSSIHLPVITVVASLTFFSSRILDSVIVFFLGLWRILRDADWRAMTDNRRRGFIDLDQTANGVVNDLLMEKCGAFTSGTFSILQVFILFPTENSLFIISTPEEETCNWWGRRGKLSS